MVLPPREYPIGARQVLGVAEHGYEALFRDTTNILILPIGATLFQCFTSSSEQYPTAAVITTSVRAGDLGRLAPGAPFRGRAANWMKRKSCCQTS